MLLIWLSKSFVLDQNALSEKYVFDRGFNQRKNACLAVKNKVDDRDQTVIVALFEKFEELDFVQNNIFSFLQN